MSWNIEEKAIKTTKPNILVTKVVNPSTIVTKVRQKQECDMI